MRVLAWLVLATGIAAQAQSLADLFDNSVAALSRGDYTAAEAGFQEILKAEPRHVDTLRNLGVVYSRTGRIDLAISVYRRALGVSPNDKNVLLNLGLAYMRAQSYADAISVFETLIKIDPRSRPGRDIHLLFPLCDGYLKQDGSLNRRRRFEDFLTALPPAAASLVRCKLFYQGERWEEAEQQCRQALQSDSQFPGAHLELARVLVAQHSPEAAGELDTAIREGSADPEALYDLGVALLQENRTAEASQYFERARLANPDFWGSYFQLGKIRLQSNQPAQAITLLRKAADLNPTSFSVVYEFARALSAAGRSEEAARAMDRVRELMALDLSKDAKAMRKD